VTRISINERERINFYFDKTLFDGLRRLATLKHTTYSELIRVACREYIIRETDPAVRADSTIRRLGSE
jgi:hypothetical protein